VVKGVLGGNPQYHICRALELWVPLIIFIVCQAHGVQVLHLYVIAKTKHIEGEGGRATNWDKLVSILFLFIIQHTAGLLLPWGLPCEGTFKIF
jgi:hypothetical protein